MIYALVGKNQYQINERLKSIQEEINHDEFSFEKIYGDESDLGILKSKLNNLGLFSETTNLILFNPTKIKGLLEEYQNLLNNIDNQTNLIIVENNIDKRSSLYSYLKKLDNFYEAKNMSRKELIDWIIYFTKQNQGEIDYNDASILLDKIGEDQLLLSSELDKLLLYSKNITKKSINLLVSSTPNSDIFSLLNNAFNNHTSTALALYDQQRISGAEPLNILGLITWQLINISLVAYSKDKNDNQIIQDTGISSYTLSSARRLLNTIGVTKLKMLIEKLSEIDYKSKTSSYNIDEALKNFIVAIS